MQLAVSCVLLHGRLYEVSDAQMPVEASARLAFAYLHALFVRPSVGPPRQATCERQEAEREHRARQERRRGRDRAASSGGGKSGSKWAVAASSSRSPMEALPPQSALFLSL